jgi:hypothetical protein
VPSIAGTVLLTILAWKELDPGIVALAWIGLGLALFEVGSWRSWPVLRNQAYVLFGLAFAALLGINLYEIYSPSLALPKRRLYMPSTIAMIVTPDWGASVGGGPATPPAFATQPIAGPPVFVGGGPVSPPAFATHPIYTPPVDPGWTGGIAVPPHVGGGPVYPSLPPRLPPIGLPPGFWAGHTPPPTVGGGPATPPVWASQIGRDRDGVLWLD